MSFTILRCDWCNAESSLPLSIKMESMDSCRTCHKREEESDTRWYFCGFTCIKRALAHGLVCKSCWGTGCDGTYTKNADGDFVPSCTCSNCNSKGYLAPRVPVIKKLCRHENPDSAY